jgi:hypothetical protein
MKNIFQSSNHSIDHDFRSKSKTNFIIFQAKQIFYEFINIKTGFRILIVIFFM